MGKKEGALAVNRRVFHDYEIQETFEAGIVLLGTEIKSLRDNGGNLQDSYIILNDSQEAYLKNASIAPYRFGGVAFNHEEKRERKLLLHKRELAKLKKFTQEKGLTVVPIALYLKNGFVKVKIAIAKGKKNYDKRAALKEKEHKRAIDRSLKNF